MLFGGYMVSGSLGARCTSASLSAEIWVFMAVTEKIYSTLVGFWFSAAGMLDGALSFTIMRRFYFLMREALYVCRGFGLVCSFGCLYVSLRLF